MIMMTAESFAAYGVRIMRSFIQVTCVGSVRDRFTFETPVEDDRSVTRLTCFFEH